jgi:hypothetical protein
MFTLDNLYTQCLEIVDRHLAEEPQGRPLRRSRLG